MDDPSCKEILLAWLETALAERRRSDDEGTAIKFYSHHIYTHTRSWGERVYSKVYSPTTFQRRWRELRDGEEQRLRNFHIDPNAIHRNYSDDASEALWILSPMSDAPLTNHETGEVVMPT